MEDLKGPSMSAHIYYVGLACLSCSRCLLPKHFEQMLTLLELLAV